MLLILNMPTSGNYVDHQKRGIGIAKWIWMLMKFNVSYTTASFTETLTDDMLVVSACLFFRPETTDISQVKMLSCLAISPIYRSLPHCHWPVALITKMINEGLWVVRNMGSNAQFFSVLWKGCVCQVYFCKGLGTLKGFSSQNYFTGILRLNFIWRRNAHL